jgi:hypothetical protein
MRSEVTDANKPRRRITKSRLAKPLLTSMGSITMLAASTFVLLAVASTGSAKPWDWTRADPAAALGRYQACGHQGLGAIGCMLGAGFRPANAASAPAGTNRALQPLVSVATVQDQVPASASSSSATARTGSSSTGHARTGTGTGTGSGSTAGEREQHLVTVQPGESTDDVIAACTAAMKTAQTQGAAAMTEVLDECESALQSRCPAVKMPQTQGAAAIQELADECAAPRPSSSPSPNPSATPRDE